MIFVPARMAGLIVGEHRWGEQAQEDNPFSLTVCGYGGRLGGHVPSTPPPSHFVAAQSNFAITCVAMCMFYVFGV